MGRQVILGEAVHAAGPTRSATPGDVLAMSDARPVVIEAYDKGPRVEVHLSGSGTHVFGAPDADAATIASAALQVVAESALLLGRVARDGVRFDDLLWLDGESLTGLPASGRLERLAHVAPVALMVERTTAEDPRWARAFLDHVALRGHDGVRVRVLGARWPAGPGEDRYALFADADRASG